VWCTVVFLGGCASSCERATPPVDVATAKDVAADVEFDDTGAVDVPDLPDDIGPAIVDEEGWAAPGWLPSFANVRFATNPARLVAPPVWVPCRDGRVGCRELQRQDVCGDPTPGGGEYASQMNHGRRNWMVFGRTERGSTREQDARVIAVSEVDGDAVLAWKRREGPLLPYEGATNPRVVDDIPYSFVRFSDNREQPEFNRLAILRGTPTIAAGRPPNLRILDNARDLRGATERYFDLSMTTAGFSSEQAVAYVPLREGLPVRSFPRPPGTTAFRTVQVEGDTVFWEATRDGRAAGLGRAHPAARGRKRKEQRVTQEGCTPVTGQGAHGGRAAVVGRGRRVGGHDAAVAAGGEGDGAVPPLVAPAGAGGGRAAQAAAAAGAAGAAHGAAAQAVAGRVAFGVGTRVAWGRHRPVGGYGRGHVRRTDGRLVDGFACVAARAHVRRDADLVVGGATAVGAGLHRRRAAAGSERQQQDQG
jgi:hypothetical protein